MSLQFITSSFRKEMNTKYGSHCPSLIHSAVPVWKFRPSSRSKSSQNSGRFIPRNHSAVLQDPGGWPQNVPPAHQKQSITFRQYQPLSLWAQPLAQLPCGETHQPKTSLTVLSFGSFLTQMLRSGNLPDNALQQGRGCTLVLDWPKSFASSP